MKKILIATLATLGFVVPSIAAPANPFSGDYGMITLSDGSTMPAALPAVDFDNYDEVIGQLNIVHYTIGELEGGGVQIVVNQCLGADNILSSAQPFLFFDNESWVTFCGN